MGCNIMVDERTLYLKELFLAQKILQKRLLTKNERKIIGDSWYHSLECLRLLNEIEKIK